MNHKTLPPLLLCFALLTLHATEDSLPSNSFGNNAESNIIRYILPEVDASLSVFQRPIDTIPAAIAVVDKAAIQQGTDQLSLAEPLAGIPGVFVVNPYNFAQDTRIAVRGFGARSDFGIRGVKLIVDGVPATTPDGQGEVDGLDLGSTQKIEIIRGPTSALYGAASGGVLLVETEDGPENPFVETRWSFGDYGLQNGQLKFAGQKDRLNYVFNAGTLEYNGYRDHSETRQHKVNTKIALQIDPKREIGLLVNVIDMPLQMDPGGLTQDAVDADREQANPRNILFDAGESVEQTKLGLKYSQTFANAQTIALTAYGIQRNFENRLPFQTGAQVHLDRFVYGTSFNYKKDFEVANFVLGFNYDYQNDERKNYDNDFGQRGLLRLDQAEDVQSVGLFATGEVQVSETVFLSAAIRQDRVDFEVDDTYLTDGLDDSGSRDFDEVSPFVGISWQVYPALTFYANATSSFETPTTTELDNPNGGGFNEELTAQTATNFELGLKSAFTLTERRIALELAAFDIQVSDALIGFELADQPGREFFRNAGEEARTGIEFSGRIDLNERLVASFAYTWSDFTYSDFKSPDGDFTGNRLPGIPEHYGDIGFNYTNEGFFFKWSTRIVGKLYADNKNQEQVDAYTVTNIKTGFDYKINNWTFRPFIGINNLFDQAYSSNIRINAFGGRYFEPAPERNIYAGFSVDYTFD